MQIRRQGTSRKDRLAAAMYPSKSPINDCLLSDLISYVEEVSQLIKYYDKNGEIKGTWAVFFQKNRIFFLAKVLQYKLTDLSETANQNQLLYLLAEEKEEEKIIALHKFIGLILSLFHILEDWADKAEIVGGINEAFEFGENIKELTEKIRLDCYHTPSVLSSFLSYKFSLSPKLIKISEKHLYQLDKMLDLPSIYRRLKEIYQTLFHQITQIQQRAKKNLEIEIYQKSNHKPLVAMMIGFLRIFQIQHQYLNNFTSRHLDYYYHTILKQKRKAAIPDQAYVNFTLKKDSSPQYLASDTLLQTAINDKGLQHNYQTMYDIWVSDAEITSLKTLFVSKNKSINFGSSYELVSNIYYAPIANSKDGLGEEFSITQKSWAIVGRDQVELSQRQKTMTPGTVGFAFSAPILHLEGGDRKINLSLEVTGNSLAELIILIEDIAKNQKKSINDIFYSLFQDALEMWVSTEQGWFEIKEFRAKPPESWKNGAIEFELILGNEAPAIANFGEEVEEKEFITQWPIIKFLLKSGSSIYAYSFLEVLKLRKVDIEVVVSNLTGITINNSAGTFDNSKPFPIFGTLTEYGSELLISAQELFLKNVQNLGIDIEWYNLPDMLGGFEKYYTGYQDNSSQNLDIKNDSFKVGISALSGGRYYPLKEEKRQELLLFQIHENKLTDITRIRDIDVKALQIVQHLNKPLELEDYDNNTQFGYLKLELTSPRCAFAQVEYQNTLSKVVTYNAYAKSKERWWRKDMKLKPLPRKPYEPIVKRITINYTAQSTISFIDKTANISPDAEAWKVFQINPYGYYTSYEEGKINSSRLIQAFNWDGYLLIGLSNLKRGIPLNLFFELSTNGKKILGAPVEVSWRYLSNNKFIQFQQEDFLYDTTYGFTTTGVVSLRIPENINKNNTILSSQCYWLLVSARGRITQVLGDALKVNVNVVNTRRVNRGEQKDFYKTNLQPQIEQLAEKNGNISGVQQISSFHSGLPHESKELLWERVSERLRHKNRAINIWDYERILLQKFPNIRQVKCIGPSTDLTLEPGQIKVIVVSEFMSPDNLRPIVNFHTLSIIHNYLKTLNTPHAKLEIVNPSYEWLKLSMSIVSKPTYEKLKGELLKALYQEIKEFICPWAIQGNVRIGSGFKKKEIIQFLHTRPYIDFITSFSIVHVYEKEILNDTPQLVEKKYEFNLNDTADATNQEEDIAPSCPWGILVPADLHLVEFIQKPVFTPPRPASIEQMSLETDFVILAEDSSKKSATEHKNQKMEDTDFFEIFNLD